jgi:hypothetical protein
MTHAMGRRIGFWLVIALTAAGVSVRAAEILRIVPIVSQDQVVVSFELADAYTAEVREALASGLRTTFTYDVDLRMAVPAWMDRTVAAAVVAISAQYDNLTRRHALSRTVDGRVVESLVTDDESVVERWLTALSRMPLCDTSRLDPNRDYYVRIRARARPSSSSLLGWAGSITGQANFTFIP